MKLRPEENVNKPFTSIVEVQTATNAVHQKIKETTTAQPSAAKPPTEPPVTPQERPTAQEPHEPAMSSSKKWGIIGAIAAGALAVAGVASLLHGRDDNDRPIHHPDNGNMSEKAAHRRAEKAEHRHSKWHHGGYPQSTFKGTATHGAFFAGAAVSAGAIAYRGKELFKRIRNGESFTTANMEELGKVAQFGMSAWNIGAGATKLLAGQNNTEKASGAADIINAAVVPSLANSIFNAVSHGKPAESLGGMALQMGTNLALSGAVSLTARKIGSRLDTAGGSSGQARSTVSYAATPNQYTDPVTAHNSPGDLAISMVSRDMPIAKKSMDRKMSHLLNTGYSY